MLRKETAEKLGVHFKERVLVRSVLERSKSVSAIVDTNESGIKKDEIILSLEIKKELNLKSGEKVDVDLAPPAKSFNYIKEKLNKKTLSGKKINLIMRDIIANNLSEAEIAMFISAVYENGMNFSETVAMVKSFLNSGSSFSIKGKNVVDKHCVGGIPGNRTTPIIVSICASQGLIFPKSSSRAITSAAGTSDVIETLASVEFSADEVKKIVKKTNACMVFGGSLSMVPADTKIINIERELHIDSESLLLSSILSKKLSVGSKNVLIDIPYGETAKVTKEKALKLKKQFEKLGRYFKINVRIVLTDGSQPIGNGIGPVLEMRDILKILNPEKIGPRDLEEKSLFLAGQILEMTKKAKIGKGYLLAKEILHSGKAFKKFREIILAQGGRVKELKLAKYKQEIYAEKKGRIAKINNIEINNLARIAGCPIDKEAGIYLYCHLGDFIEKGDKIFTIYAESKPRLNEAVRYYYEKKPIYFS
jgi:putative thymidine phosphorylase